MFVYVFVYTHAYIFASVRVRACVYIYMYVCICMCLIEAPSLTGFAHGELEPGCRLGGFFSLAGSRILRTASWRNRSTPLSCSFGQTAPMYLDAPMGLSNYFEMGLRTVNTMWLTFLKPVTQTASEFIRSVSSRY